MGGGCKIEHVLPSRALDLRGRSRSARSCCSFHLRVSSSRRWRSRPLTGAALESSRCRSSEDCSINTLVPSDLQIFHPPSLVSATLSARGSGAWSSGRRLRVAHSDSNRERVSPRISGGVRQRSCAADLERANPLPGRDAGRRTLHAGASVRRSAKDSQKVSACCASMAPYTCAKSTTFPPPPS